MWLLLTSFSSKAWLACGVNMWLCGWKQFILKYVLHWDCRGCFVSSSHLEFLEYTLVPVARHHLNCQKVWWPGSSFFIDLNRRPEVGSFEEIHRNVIHLHVKLRHYRQIALGNGAAFTASILNVNWFVLYGIVVKAISLRFCKLIQPLSVVSLMTCPFGSKGHFEVYSLLNLENKNHIDMNQSYIGCKTSVCTSLIGQFWELYRLFLTWFMSCQHKLNGSLIVSFANHTRDRLIFFMF